MAGVRGPRPQVGSAGWISEERSSALQIVDQEIEEFSYSARNELEWINEHMAGILNENEINLAETFKSPGKFRTRTPQTTRKQIAPDPRLPLSDVFASTSNGPKPQPPPHNTPIAPTGTAATTTRFQSPHFHQLTRPTPLNIRPTSPRREPNFSPKKSAPSLVPPNQDPGHGSQDARSQPDQKRGQGTPRLESTNRPVFTAATPLRLSPAKQPARDSPAKAFDSTADERVHGPTNDEQEEHCPKDGKNSENENENDNEKDNENDNENDNEDDNENNNGKGDDNQHGSYTPAGSPTPAPLAQQDDELEDDRSSTEASSPVRPVGRKSSLNFASLPAREPLTGGKSLGGGLSRPGPADGSNNRASYYQRATGGKSLGNAIKGDLLNADDNGMNVDKTSAADAAETERQPLFHSKTYTQRLQDQISLLGKAQVKAALTVAPIIPPNVAASEPSTKPDSPPRDPIPTTPGSFADAEDDDEDWIDPPKTLDEGLESAPPLSKSYTAEIMEGIYDKNSNGQASFGAGKDQPDELVLSPQKFASVGRGFQHVLGHHKSPSLAATSANSLSGDSQTLAQPSSNADPAPPADHASEFTPSKSPVRTTRESPLKHVKNKLSSILKSSRGLLASSATPTAEGKTMLSPSASRLALHLGPSSESIVPRPLPEVPETMDVHSQDEPSSPGKPIGRRTRASTEREKEEKRREREAKYMADQNEKLDKAREEQRERARVFGKEQEQVAAMEKKVASKGHHQQQQQQQERVTSKEAPLITRGSPEKATAREEVDSGPADADVEMTDEGSGPSTKAGGPVPANQTKDNKQRPVKPTRETMSKVKQAPTVIRVNTGSQTSQYGSRVSTASHETAGISGSQASAKPGSKPTLQSKSSSQNLKSLPAAVRPKALDMSVKKKEQEEREAQRRRDAKAEVERKRAAIQEEQRKQAERQRQAAAEKARQGRAPPASAMRSQAGGPSDGSGGYGQQRGESSRPPSRMTSGVPVSTSLASAVKAGPKRALAPDAGDDGPAKRPQSRGGPTYQAKDAKRRRTSEVVHESDMGPARNIKGPPVRPSNGFKKDLPSKSVFSNGYTAAPPHTGTRDLFKATVTAQHNSQVKGSHPLDLAQISKGPIPFAANAGASSSATSHKTPARIPSFAAGKSTAKKGTRSSPRFQNGESIELPEIQTDDEDEDEDAQAMMVATWADSPDLRRALIRQETVDPSQIFGPPAPLNMEEVFNKSKDKWHKFRQRTSSANWNGLDRLTEEDIRKDMAAREKLRRDGGWSYEMSKGL